MTQGPPDFPQASPSEKKLVSRNISVVVDRFPNTSLILVEYIYRVQPCVDFICGSYSSYTFLHVLILQPTDKPLPTNNMRSELPLQLLIRQPPSMSVWSRLSCWDECQKRTATVVANQPTRTSSNPLVWLSAQPSLTCCCWCNAHRGAERFKNLPKKWTEGRNFKEPRKCHHIIRQWCALCTS